MIKERVEYKSPNGLVEVQDRFYGCDVFVSSVKCPKCGKICKHIGFLNMEPEVKMLADKSPYNGFYMYDECEHVELDGDWVLREEVGANCIYKTEKGCSNPLFDEGWSCSEDCIGLDDERK